MRVLIQKVIQASVTIDGELKSSIGKGMLVLVGVEDSDNENDIEWLVKKTVNLRIFDDAKGVMNLSVIDVKGEVLVVSQFTLMASTAKGNRPSYIKAARPEISVPVYEKFIEKMEEAIGKKVMTGKFGADMKVELINDGPVTIAIDSKRKE